MAPESPFTAALRLWRFQLHVRLFVSAKVAYTAVIPFHFDGAIGLSDCSCIIAVLANDALTDLQKGGVGAGGMAGHLATVHLTVPAVLLLGFQRNNPAAFPAGLGRPGAHASWGLADLNKVLADANKARRKVSGIAIIEWMR